MVIHIGDTVFIPQASAAAMAYYAEHKKEIECPCKWRNEYGVVDKLTSLFVHVHSMSNLLRKSVFQINDVQFVQHGGVDE
jgi:hypothetical protein